MFPHPALQRLMTGKMRSIADQVLLCSGEQCSGCLSSVGIVGGFFLVVTSEPMPLFDLVLIYTWLKYLLVSYVV